MCQFARDKCALRIGILLLIIQCLSCVAHASDRVALVIGNGNYQSVPTLTNPTNDASDIQEALRQMGFEVIGGANLNRDEMLRVIHHFSGRLKTAEIAAVYYAGHGLQVDRKNYLVPVDAKLRRLSDLPAETIELSDLLRIFDDSNIRRQNLVFIDACRDNPFTASLASDPDAGTTMIREGSCSNS